MRYQLRRYTIRPGEMDAWVAEWISQIRPLRQKMGFEVYGAWRVEDSDDFVWILCHDGPESWDEANDAYYSMEARTARDPDPARHIAHAEKWFLDALPAFR